MADEIEQLRAELVAANNDLKIVLDTLRDRNVLLTESEDELAKLRAELRAAVDTLRALPLDDFDKGMDACDAAEFVDHAGDFFEAMQKARVVVAKHPESK